MFSTGKNAGMLPSLTFTDANPNNTVATQIPRHAEFLVEGIIPSLGASKKLDIMENTLGYRYVFTQ
jgi:hypothetical protein